MLAMGAWRCLEDLAQYSSPKYIRVQSVTWGCVKGLLYLALVASLCYVIVIFRLHQEVDEVISSVRTSVKGVAYTKDRIWDIAEYTLPMQATNSFFVITNIIMTENQRKQRCPEYPFVKAICRSDTVCKNGSVNIHSGGIQTGRCVVYNETFNTCEVEAWCPVQPMENPPEPAILTSSKDFTVLIKNNIHFPKFNLTELNIPEDFNTSCIYNKTTSPLCPIFRLGDIVQEANQKFSEMAVKGGVIAIQIHWKCNLDKWSYHCSPKYRFHRLDDKKTLPGFRISYARHYKLPNGEEKRTLFKAYGIRFDVLVFGTGRKFKFFELIKNIGSMISYFGLVASAMEILICIISYSNCRRSAFCKIYNRKKYETVLNPTEVMYVSYVDEPHVILIKTPLKTSLQHAKGSIVKSHQMKFCDAGSCWTSESNENQDNEGSEPMRTTESNENQDNEGSEPMRTTESNENQDNEGSELMRTTESNENQDNEGSELMRTTESNENQDNEGSELMRTTESNENQDNEGSELMRTTESNENQDNEGSELMRTTESNENQDNEGSELMRTTESNENQDNKGSELGRSLRQEASSSDCQKWCCCGECQPTQKYHEQLCCRRKKGQCITTSHLFQQLVLSRHTLEEALLYKDPLLNLADVSIKNQLHHLAYKQYIHWRFGCFDLEDRAIVPSCCRGKIEGTYGN